MKLYVSSINSLSSPQMTSTLKSQGRITIKDNNSNFIVSVITHRLNITAISNLLFVYLRIRLFFVFSTNPQFRLIRVKKILIEIIFIKGMVKLT